ncbi:MAG: hypothetical protein ACOYMA_14400 [Bacteroidia bacterium]
MKYSIIFLFLFIFSIIQAQEIKHKCITQVSYVIRNDSAVYSGTFDSELIFTFSKTFIERDFGLKKYNITSNENNNGYFLINNISLDDNNKLSLFGNRNYIYIIDDKYLFQYYYNTGKSKLFNGVIEDPYVPYDYAKHPITGYTVYVFESNIENYLKNLYNK